MPVGSPWSVKGIDPRARAVAKSAARRDGLTLGEWLNRVILDDNEDEPDWARRAATFPGFAQAGGGGGGDDGEEDVLGAMVERLGERLDATEQRSSMALNGVDHAILSLARRLEALEDAREDAGEDGEERFTRLREAQDEALERIRRLEKDGPGGGEALKAVETALGKVARRLYETEQGVRAEMDEFSSRELRQAKNTERALRTLDGRVKDGLQRERAERSALQDRIDAARGEAGEAKRRAEETKRSSARALSALASTQERVSDRLQALERETEGKLSREVFESRFQALSNELASTVRETRLQLSSEVERASGSPREIERALASAETRMQAAEQRHADAIARIGQEIERLAHAVDRRLSETERKAELRESAADGRRARADLDQRLDHVRRENADAVKRIGEQVAKLGANLAERVNRSEQRSAAAVEAAGERMADMVEKLDSRRSAPGEADLDARIRASEARTAERIEAALAKVGERLEGAREETAEALSPVQRAMTALADRLEAIERAAPRGAGEAEAPDASQAPAIAAPDFSTPLPPAPGLERDGFDDDAFEAGADFEYVAEDAPAAQASPDAFVVTAPDPDFTPDPDPAPEPEKRPAKRPVRLGATADADFIASARASARKSGGRSDYARFEPDREASAGSGRARAVLIAASVAGFLAIGAAAGLLVIDAQSTPERADAASLSSVFADPAPASAVPANPSSELDPAAAPSPPSSAPEPAGAEAAEADPAAGGVDPAAVEAGAVEPVQVSNPAPEAAVQPAIAAGPVTLQDAARAGDPVARYQLALNRADAGDAEGAAALMRRAAEQGVPDAQYRYAKMLEAGTGARRDLDAALDWTLRAAEDGHGRAMHNAGVMYATGLAGAENYDEAARWFQEAALHGVRDSQFNLALFFEQGLGVPESLPDAYAWFLIAGAGGDGAASERAEALRRDVPAQARAQADAAAQNFSPRPLDPEAQGRYPPQPWETGVAAPAVARAQGLLAALGYEAGAPDGAYGPRTRRAVARYQSDEGLEETGVIDDALIARLERAAPQ